MVDLNEQFLSSLKPNRPQYRETPEGCWSRPLMELRYFVDNYPGKSKVWTTATLLQLVSLRKTDVALEWSKPPIYPLFTPYLPTIYPLFCDVALPKNCHDLPHHTAAHLALRLLSYI